MKFHADLSRRIEIVTTKAKLDPTSRNILDGALIDLATISDCTEVAGVLLRQSLTCLNQIVNTRINDPKIESTYKLAAKIEKFLNQ